MTLLEAWLVYYKGANAKDGIGYGESVEEALGFGWIDGLVKRVDDDRYMRRFTPRVPKSKWSASNKKRVVRLLEDGRMAGPGRRVIDAAKADGSWDEMPDAERQWEMPSELRQVLGFHRYPERHGRHPCWRPGMSFHVGSEHIEDHVGEPVDNRRLLIETRSDHAAHTRPISRGWPFLLEGRCIRASS